MVNKVWCASFRVVKVLTIVNYFIVPSQISLFRGIDVLRDRLECINPEPLPDPEYTHISWCMANNANSKVILNIV